MKLVRVDVRFFRSFNYDYEEKTKEGAQARAWEEQPPAWYPFVRVPIESDITAVVGANEAGKSQLLTAIKSALTGSPIERADFCRYSGLFSVQTGAIRYPEFGAIFQIEPEDVSLSAVPALDGHTTFGLYRPGRDAPFLVVDGQKRPLSIAELKVVEAALPTFHELRTNLAIPDSVSIAELAGRPRNALHDRRSRSSLYQSVLALVAGTDPATAGNAVLSSLAERSDEASKEVERKRREEFELARQLLVDAARVDPQAFNDLEAALESGREGEVEAIIGGINAAIKENLNVQRWWSQDRDFELRVEARERELAFTIQDRTASKYSFGERSQGLRFFLSYFVQLTAHRINNVKPDLLLLDEPDAFLSSAGQQDLLRVLEDYAAPEAGGPRSQVVYVTHSPFLIDKNAPHRIRVLDKGAEDEGTRVVRDAANNRYEPLRSSLGQYVAETAFIGGRNLFVEGAVDQILIAGLTAHMAKLTGSHDGLLNLNDVTVVACGGADGIPYMVYLARGRDSIKPPCVVLLDGDRAGRDAQRVLERGEARKKRVLDRRFVIRLDEWANRSGLEFDRDVQVEEIEDLIPIPLARRAALNYLARFVDLGTVVVDSFTSETICAELRRNGGHTWDAVAAAFSTAFPDEHLEKVGLAREVVSLLDLDTDADGAARLRDRFAVLLRSISESLDDAHFDEEVSRSDSRVKRAVRSFTSNHPLGMKKVDAQKLLRELDTALGVSDFTDVLHSRILRINREYELQDLAATEVPNFAAFRTEIRSFATSERAGYQDDASRDPSASYPDIEVTIDDLVKSPLVETVALADPSGEGSPMPE